MISKSKFQINSSKLFLTYPEADGITKEGLYDFLSNELQDQPEEILVAQEHHKNGHVHFHAYLAFTEPFRTRNPRFADYTAPDGRCFHGNYQGCRSKKNVVKYCTKEDDFKANFDVAASISGGESRTKIFGKRIMAGEDFNEVMQEFPEYIKGYKRLKEDVAAYQTDQQERSTIIELPGEVPNPWGQTYLVDTDVKRCHYWFFSKEPNKGKTTGVVNPLLRDHHAYMFNNKDIYHEIRKSTKVICMDEVARGFIKAQDLNRICDGNASFRVFMGGNIKLDEKPLVIVCSNFSINEVFPIMNELVHKRFNEIDVSNFDLV